MTKVNGLKGKVTVATLAGALLTGCGGGGSNNSTPENINHAPEIKGVPTTLSITEGTSKTVNNLICTDQDGDNVVMTVKSSNSDLNVSYNNTNLTLDASTINLADGVNLSTNVALTCSDGDKNTTKNIDVTIQDEANDRLLTYTTNIPSQVSYNGELNGTIALNDPDGSLSQNLYNFDLLDENNNSVYNGDMVDVNDDGNYTFSIDLSTLSLAEGNYTFQTEAITPVVGGENPQGDVVITQDIELINNRPVAIDGNLPGNGSNPYTFNMNDFISDAESPDSDLQIQIVTEPSDNDGTICGTATVNGQDVTINIDRGRGGTFYIEYKVIDPEGKESDVKKITINHLDNV